MTTAIFIHSICKSAEIIKSLNRLGLCASYDEVLQHRTRLASYTVESCENNVPTPRHFDRKLFTFGAFDNFDQDEKTLSGLNSTHDTVAVLSQESSDSTTQNQVYPKLR